MGTDMASSVAPDLFGSEQVITCHDAVTGLRAVIPIDNTTLGPGFGGTRWRPYASPEAAVIEAQRLAAAMTLKHACADLPYGGAKSVILADSDTPLEGERRRAALEAFGEFVARTNGSYVPGVDMGTAPADMRVIETRGARTFCDEVDPGPYTARGVYAVGEALRAAGVTVVPDFVATRSPARSSASETGSRTFLAEAESRDVTPEQAAHDRAAQRLSTAAVGS